MILLCLKIFAARIIDVTLGTVKTFYIFKEKRITSFIISFFELIIWFYAARTALSMEINSIFIPISYALGYATGTYIGTFISSKYIKGHLTVNVISNKITKDEIREFKDKNFGITSIKTEDNKHLLIIEIEKSRLNELKETISKIDDSSFIIVNDTRIVQNGYIK